MKNEITKTECSINVNHLAIINEAEVNSVKARDLHEFLEVSTRFNGWITGRINQYGFVEGVDFLTFTENPAKLGRPSKEYVVSLDMAKELSMVERNSKGKEARQYFIQCEKALMENLRVAIDKSERARKIAISDKMQISEKREATAIGRLGGLTTSNKKLRLKVDKLEADSESSRTHTDRLIESLTKYRQAKPISCHIPEERPKEIKRYHVETLIQSFAYASKREKQEVRLEVYSLFNKRFPQCYIFSKSKVQKVAIIEIIRRRGLMDKLYDIVIRCMKEFNNLIPELERPHEDFSKSANSDSFTGNHAG